MTLKYKTNQISIKEILPKVYDEEQLVGVTGINFKQFMLLLGIFEEVTIEYQQKTYKKHGSIPKITLAKTAEKLFFILLYLKSCPSFDQLGFLFGMDNEIAFKQIKKTFPLLIETLSRFNMLPETSFETPEEMQFAFVNIKKLLIDASERVITLDSLIA